MNIKEQIGIVEELLEAVKELSEEYENGWETEIDRGRELLKHLKSVNKKNLYNIKNTDDILEVLGDKEMDFKMFHNGTIIYFFDEKRLVIEVLLGHNSSIPDIALKPKMLLKELRLDSVVIMKDGKTIFDNL